MYCTTGFPNKFWTTFRLFEAIQGTLRSFEAMKGILKSFETFETFETLIQNLLGHPVLGNLLQQFLVSFSLVQLFMRLECRRTMKL